MTFFLPIAVHLMNPGIDATGWPGYCFFRMGNSLNLLETRLRNALRFLGVDRAVFYSVASRAASALMSPITFACIALYLTADEQGYYYTFSSVLGISVFLNLGLTNVLLLFASHEKAHLTWTPEGSLTGDIRAFSRLSALYRFGAIWFAVGALLILVLVMPIGFVLFSFRHPASPVSWQVPWCAASLVGAGTFLIAPAMVIIEGCGRVRELRALGLVTALICTPVLWLSLRCGMALLSGPIFFGLGLLISFLWAAKNHRRLFRHLLADKEEDPKAIWAELWPLQWRLAVNWLGGYAGLLSFTPIAFAVLGPGPAGQVGMTMAIAQTIGTVGMYWITNRTPLFGTLWAKRNYNELDRLFRFTLQRAIVVTVAGCIATWSIVFGLTMVAPQYACRLVPLLPLASILASLPLNSLVFAMANYLRADKLEVMVWVTLPYGLAVVASNILMGRAYGLVGFTTGYLILTVLHAMAGTLVFIHCRRRRQHHQDDPPHETQTALASH